MDSRTKFELWESATTHDIMNNPVKYGAPTLQDFKSRRSYYANGHNKTFGRIDKGGAIANKYTKKQIFEIEGYRCKTLEEVERVALNLGLDLKTLKYQAHFLPLGGGSADMLVKFISEADLQKRNKND